MNSVRTALRRIPQLDKSLLEYTAALQRIVSLEKMIASKADVEEQNEQLQEKVGRLGVVQSCEW